MEFGLLLPLLVVMLFGTTELGRAIYTYNTLDKTVRDAARHLSQHGPGDAVIRAKRAAWRCTATTSCSGAVAGARAHDQFGAFVRRASAAPARMQLSPPASASINLVTVSIQGYAYNSLVQFVVPDLTFNNISVTMRAQL